MLFADSDTQRLLRDTARSYLADKFPTERLYAFERGDERLTDADLRGFGDMGWWGLLAPEPEGGGLTPLEAAVVVEELGYAAVPAPVAAANIAACLLAASDAARALLGDVASGRRLCTVSEATRRRGPRQAGLRAPDGRLTGTLPLVPFAGLADFVLAPIAIGGEPAFAAVALAGAEREPARLLDRATYFDLRFDGASLDPSVVLATGSAAETLHERCDALVTAFSLIEMSGMLQRVLEMTSAYISQRVQFGQPIAKFQAARHRAAELLMQTETTRWAAYHALWRLQRDPSDTSEVWLAKHWAARAADRVYQISHLLHGGVGVGMDYPLHLYTLGVAALAVRAGTMDELVSRTIDSLTGAPA